MASGFIRNVYSTGLVQSNSSSAGGLVGSSNINIQNGYWNIETSGKTTSAGGVGVHGKTTEEMKQWSTFNRWDSNIWGVNININNGYPHIK